MSAHLAPATWPRRLLVALGVVALLALAALLFAWNRAAPETAQAAGPGPGMSLDGPATVFEGLPFTLTINTTPAPDVEIEGFASEVLFPDELKWLQRPNCRGPGPDGEVQVERQDGSPLALCNSFSPILTGGAAHSVISQFSSPAPALNVTPGSTTTLVELDFVCNTAGSYKLTLTAVPNSPDGAHYGSLFGELILVKTTPQEVADTITINCVSGPVPSPTPTALPLPPTPTALPLPPTPPPCPLTPSGSPLPGMSLEAPATVFAGATFTLCVNADPAPGVEISGFASEVLFPDGLKSLPRASCLDEVQVGRLDGGDITTCISFSPVTGGAAHSVLSDSVPPLPALDVAAGSTTTLLALDFTCNEVGSHKLTLTAVRPFQPGDGALYVDTQASTILVKTVLQDYDGDTTANEVADTLIIDCVEPFDFNGTPVAVGGLQTALAPPASSSTNVGVLASIAAVATAAGVIALGSASWYARRHPR